MPGAPKIGRTPFSDPDPKYLSPDDRDQAEAAKRLAAERAEQNAESAPVGTPAKPQSWAMKLHEQQTAAALTGADHLALATHEHAEAVKARELANERLVNAEHSLQAARNRAESEAKEQVRQAAEGSLRQVRDQVAAIHARLLKLHQTFGGQGVHTTGRGPLGEIARTIIASWDPKVRTRATELNREAQQIALRLAKAYQTADKALKAFDLATTRGWGLEQAEVQIRAALAIDPAQIRKDAESLVSEWETLRKPANTKENASPPQVESYVPEHRPQAPPCDVAWNRDQPYLLRRPTHHATADRQRQHSDPRTLCPHAADHRGRARRPSFAAEVRDARAAACAAERGPGPPIPDRV